MEKAVILCAANQIRPEDFYFNQNRSPATFESVTLEEMEKKMILQCLKSNDQNMSMVAQQLGITRQTLYNKLKKYGL